MSNEFVILTVIILTALIIFSNIYHAVITVLEGIKFSNNPNMLKKHIKTWKRHSQFTMVAYLVALTLLFVKSGMPLF